MDTNDFVVLACLIENFYISGCKITFIGGTKKFNNHLYNIKFKEYWQPNFDRTAFTLSYNKTTLCLWKISKDMIYSYSKYASEYFEQFASDRDLVPLTSNIDEVFNHSKSLVTRYIITQFYPKNKKLSFSVCDFGIGIPQAIKDSEQKFSHTFEDWEAIIKSLEEGFSTNSTPRNRGFGLNNILCFTENSNGKLVIISNNGKVVKEAKKMYVSGYTGYNFSGTLIKVEIDLDSLDDKLETEQIFDF